MNKFRTNIHSNNPNTIIISSTKPLTDSIISHEIPQYLNYAFSIIRATRASLASQLAEEIFNNNALYSSKLKIKIILPKAAHKHLRNIDNLRILISYGDLSREIQDLCKNLYLHNIYIVDDAFRFTRREFGHSSNTEILYYSTKSPESIANLYFKRFGLSQFVLHNYLAIPELKDNYLSYTKVKIQRTLYQFSRKTEEILKVDKNLDIHYSHKAAIEDFKQTKEGMEIIELMNEYNVEMKKQELRNIELNQRYSQFISTTNLHFRSYLKGIESKNNNAGKEAQLVEYLKYTLFAFSEYLLSYKDILIDNPYEMLFSIGYILFAQKKRLEKTKDVDEQKKQEAINIIEQILVEIGLKFENNQNNNQNTQKSFSSLYYQYIKLICDFEKKLNKLDSENDYNNINSLSNSVPLQKQIYLSKCEMENKFHLIYSMIFDKYAKIFAEIHELNKKTFEMELVTVRCIAYYLKHSFFYTPDHYLDAAFSFLLSNDNLKKFVTSKCRSNKIERLFSEALNELKIACKLTYDEQKKFDEFSYILKTSKDEEEQYYQKINMLKSRILEKALCISDEKFQTIKEMLLLQLMITTTHGFYKSQIPMEMSLDAILNNPYNAAMLVSIKASLCSYASNSISCNYKNKLVKSVLGKVDAFTRTMNLQLCEVIKPVHLPLAQPFFAYDNGVPFDMLTKLRSSSHSVDKKSSKSNRRVEQISNDELICFANLSDIESYSGSFEKADPLAGIVIGDSMYSSKSEKKYIFMPFREEDNSNKNKEWITSIISSLALFSFSNEIYLQFKDTSSIIQKETVEYHKLLQEYINAHRQRFINGTIIKEPTKKTHYPPAIISLITDSNAQEYIPNKEKELILGLFYSNIVTSTMVYSLLSSLIEKDSKDTKKVS